MADLSTSIAYRRAWDNRTPFYAHKRRRVKDKIIPNYDNFWNYVSMPVDHFDVPYSQYKTLMLGKVRLCEMTEYRGMIVNRGGHPKTNTTETCYKHLRRMIKDGILKMEKRSAYGRNVLSVLVTT